MKSLLALAAAALLPAVSALASPGARGNGAIEVSSAYRNGRGELLVELRASGGAPEKLFSGNTILWGDPRLLRQLDLAWPDEGASSGSERVAELGDGEIRLSGSEAETSCSSRVASFARLSETETRALESSLRSGRTAIRWLPEVREPRYLFQVRGRRELVLVTEPRFNFHGDYEVYIGRPARFREIPVAVPGAEWRNAQPGRIRFRAGGGIYVPETIELLRGGRRSDRGSPTLIREARAAQENLEIPRSLTREQILKLGFGRRSAIRAPSPCEEKGSPTFFQATSASAGALPAFGSITSR